MNPRGGGGFLEVGIGSEIWQILDDFASCTEHKTQNFLAPSARFPLYRDPKTAKFSAAEGGRPQNSISPESGSENKGVSCKGGGGFLSLIRLITACSKTNVAGKLTSRLDELSFELIALHKHRSRCCEI